MTAPATVPLPDLLERIAVIVGEAAAEVDACQACLELTEADDESIRQLQSLDAVSQTLHALSAVIGHASATAPGQPVDIGVATDGIGLAGLVQRLSSGVAAAPICEDVELF